MNIPQAPSRSSINSVRLRARVGLTAANDDGKPDTSSQILGTVGGLLSIAGGAVGVYHGYGRNRGSVGWAIGWGLLGSLFPIFVIPIALVQGIGKPARK